MFKGRISKCCYLLTYTILSSGVSDQIRMCKDVRFQILPSTNDKKSGMAIAFIGQNDNRKTIFIMYIGLVRSNIERGSMLNQYTVTRVN